MKKLLLSLAAIAAFSVSAETVVLDLAKATDIKGTKNEEKLKTDGTLQQAPNYQPLESMVVDGYTISGKKLDAGADVTVTDVAYYMTPSTNAKTKPTLRVYKNNEITVAAPAGVGIAKLDFALNKAVNGAFANNTTYGYTASGEKSAWTVTYNQIAETVKFTVAANVQILSITVTTGTVGETPEQPEQPSDDDVIYSGLIANADDWTIDNVNLPSGLTYVWKWDSRGYMKASAYKGEPYTAKAELISPVIDVKDYYDISISFDHAAKFQTSLQDLCSFGVKLEGSNEITNLPISSWPTAGGWDFSTETFVRYNFGNQKVQFVFTYGSSVDDGADTWEIKNFYVKGVKRSGVENVEIDANAPVEYFNLQGVRVENPANGLFIVRQGNKVTKQVIR